ncbi:M50 family metallopeptidase [uncultured Roseovarius sp.]|uniref:M50 family metallopeptidase n=1 Tax=uncultured Roseovarius sp. TaxID=293344 RepID=UPI002624E8BE|nr:M50 family metallopeptidase [uncultured Roseovarius sp.]
MKMITGHWQLILITGIVFLLWNTPAIFPLKILIVFMHELSHGLAALLTGGMIVDITLSPQQGGQILTRGGSAFATLSAGYVGSLLIGIVLLILALRTNADRLLLGFCGVVILLVTAFYIRDSFALIFCAITGILMLAVSRYLSIAINDMVLRVIGLTSMLYVPYDIFDDTIARSGMRSDAYMLAERVGGTAALWGAIWLVLSLAVILLCLKYGIGQNSNITFVTASDRHRSGPR